ncbi:General negative regulator of transcription subunit 1 [Escovopsis weberi]|uniref:General negative regulator of transcription subunit 1 n=1 Tax=Escovopsis weberi TaxID=150374 RepID=A0A0M8MV46_ESCWE|nr:General negative regulator of transcription subunit 1 [Escovopsis weberi]
MRKIAHDVDQAAKIAESVENGTEDIFRDFDLSTFMEHFKLDALEKTLLALAFKLGSRLDLKTKVALTYTIISQTPSHDPSVLVNALVRIVPKSFDWNEVVNCFDQPSARISSAQFLRLYNALLPIAQDAKNHFDIQRLWGGSWNEPEAQLSFVSAYASLTPDQLDTTTIPGLERSISVDDYVHSPPNVQERASVVVKHPLVSVAALSAIFNVALNSVHASQTVEAKRLFQEVVVPNLDIFLVSAFEVPRQSWAPMAVDTLNSLFETFLYKRSPEYDFVLDSLWKKDKEWVMQRLIDAHAVKPVDLPLVFDHAVKHNWLDELVYLPNGFGIDLAAFAHAEGYLDLTKWARFNAERSNEIARTLLQFLMIKANLEIQFQRPPDGQPPVKTSTILQVRTVSALLQILEDFLPKAPVQDLILVQRHCITAYPRLINYGEGYDDIIHANGKDGNALPQAANSKMEEHYKKMYGDEIQVRTIVEILDRYKHSRDPLDQDVFACMIHGLFDEYNHYVDYPLEALATTAVLFGGIISHKLISDLPLKIGLGMILEAVRDHMPDDPMYKFGLQALMQLLVRLREWPGFCKQLLQIPGLQGTEAFKKAEEIVRDHEEELVRARNGTGTPHGIGFPGDSFANGTSDEQSNSIDRPVPPFASINADPIPPNMEFEDPDEDAQGKIQFALNNITEGTLQLMCTELRDMLERKHQQWFASHLVEERAKMQPNYHHVYLELVKSFEDKSLWSEVLRETYVSVTRMLNSEATMQNVPERTHLKNLGGWLGLLTLARDYPIKHKNLAFKQLLIEAHDTKRLIVVIPFVCKVLIQGANSAVFRPPNPWLMDILHLLIELYHHAELKLNLKFEIEVLCKGLNLDHKSIEPSGEILNRPAPEDSVDVLQPDQLDAFESLSLNGIGSPVGPGLSTQTAPPTIPDIGPLITIPPTNEMVPVVDRSVTIAAISTQQMIRKDFIAEPDENRVRTSAINMVKATAGSLALVTSKEPLRANLTNNMRALASDLPSGLPEGTIIMWTCEAWQNVSVLDVVDALVQLIIKTSQNSEEFVIYAAEPICALIFQQIEDNLTLESLVHVLETLRKISGPALNNRVRALFAQQPGPSFLSMPLLTALIRTDLLDWKNIDLALSKVLEARKAGSLEFLEDMLELTLLNNRPIAMYADFVRTLEASWSWICDEPNNATGQRLKSKLLGLAPSNDDQTLQQDQLEYVFEEWVHLCNNQNASPKATGIFVQQLQGRRILRSREDLFLFIRTAIDLSVDRYEQLLHNASLADACLPVDALAKLISVFVGMHADTAMTRADFVNSIWVLISLVLNHHYEKRGELLNQRVFFRLLSTLLHEVHTICENVSDEERRAIYLKVANRFEALGPQHLPSFAFGWLSLIQHRAFMPELLQLPDNAGWAAYTQILCQLLDFVGHQLKAFVVTDAARDFCRGALKLFVILHHDFPDFLAANHVRLCANIPTHCTQLLNAVLTATPHQNYGRSLDGAKGERMEDLRVFPGLLDEAIGTLNEAGLLHVLDQIVDKGPSEEAVAQVAHAITTNAPKETTYGHIAVTANPLVISAVVIYVAQHASERLQAGGGLNISGNEPEVALLSILVHELPPEVRYYLMASMINQLRFPNPHTEFFSQVLLHIFGKDLNDPEETDIRQEITRILLERLVAERFASVLQRA